MTEMIARREMMAIGQDQLRFNADEIMTLAETLYNFRLPRANAERLLEQLEGWPAGTILALQPLPQDLEHLMLRGEGPEALFCALADMMMDAQPPGLRDFLLASSTLPRMTPELVSTVLRLPNSTEWLAEVVSRNLFVSRTSLGLTYHRLFRDFLQKRLAEQRPDWFSQLHLNAATWFDQNGDVEEAFAHYIDAGCPEKADEAIQTLIHAYFTQGRIETLLRWNETLTRAGVLDPQLLYVCASELISRYEYDTAETYLSEAGRLFDEQHDDTGVANVHLHLAGINVQRGNYFQAITQVQNLAQMPPDSSNIRGRALRLLGFANLKLGLVETATQNLESALELYRQTGDLSSVSKVLLDLEVAYLYTGRLSDAAACLQEVVAIRRAIGSPIGLARALNNLGYHYHQFGDYAQAQSCFEEGLSVVAQVQDRRTEGYLLWSLGDLQRDRGGFDEALMHYNRSLELVSNNEPSLRCNLLISISTLRRWQNHFYDASALAEEAVAIANAHKLALESATARSAMWVARAFMGEFTSAAHELDLIASELQTLQAKTEVIHVLTMRAIVSYLRADRSYAEGYLKSAVQIAQSGASIQPLIAEIVHHPFMGLLVPAETQRFNAITQRVTRLLKAQMKPTNIIRLEDKLDPETIYSLRIQTLGKEIIERDGVLVLTTDWRAAAAKGLFFYLLFVGPETREQICLVFWPDSSPARVRSNFHTTLYRVRQALGENVIIFKDEKYCVNPALDIWCDAHEFQNLARQARPLSTRDARTEDLWRRGAALYQGDLLPQLDAEWMLPYREELREIYLESVANLGLCAQARKDYKQAVMMYKQALKLDPYREEVHRTLMLCYAEQGERGKIQTHFRNLQKLFDEELAVEPSAETKLLVRSLLR
jgi:ATP/maltotriose-dependent transcriptional regulator MalT/DNA-binding SARP family transcriptional activator